MIKVLEEIEYKVRRTCANCIHSLVDEDPLWAVCRRWTMTMPEPQPSRPLNVHTLGWCPRHEHDDAGAKMVLQVDPDLADYLALLEPLHDAATTALMAEVQAAGAPGPMRVSMGQLAPGDRFRAIRSNGHQRHSVPPDVVMVVTSNDEGGLAYDFEPPHEHLNKNGEAADPLLEPLGRWPKGGGWMRDPSEHTCEVVA